MRTNSFFIHMWRKIGFYILSLWLLFLLVSIITVDIPLCLGEECMFIGFEPLLKKNVVGIVSLIMILVGVGVFQKFKFDLKGTTQIPFQIIKIESINYEHLTFLATYIIPLVTFKLDEIRYLIVLLVLLISMGAIYIKTDMFYANPSLALLGFRIYKVDGSFKSNQTRTNIIVISKSRLFEDERVQSDTLQGAYDLADNCKW